MKLSGETGINSEELHALGGGGAQYTIVDKVGLPSGTSEWCQAAVAKLATWRVPEQNRMLMLLAPATPVNGDLAYHL